MTVSSRRAAGALALCLLAFTMPAYAVSCLLFPLACLKPKKKYGEEMEALVLDVRRSRTDYYETNVYTGVTTANPMQNTRTWYIWFKVGDTLYQGERQETILQMWYTPPREEWVGKTAKMRFLDKKWMGLKGALVVFERDKGKEWEFAVVSIVGPNGIDECAGRLLCPQQAEVDRAKREEEQLAKLGKTGGKSASDVAPMPVEEPAEQAVAAASAAEAAAPAEAAVPAEAPAPATEPAPAAEATPAETPTG